MLLERGKILGHDEVDRLEPQLLGNRRHLRRRHFVTPEANRVIDPAVLYGRAFGVGGGQGAGGQHRRGGGGARGDHSSTRHRIIITHDSASSSIPPNRSRLTTADCPSPYSAIVNSPGDGCFRIQRRTGRVWPGRGGGG